MYGHVKGESGDRVYMFDTEPWYKTYDKNMPVGSPTRDNYRITTALLGLVHSVRILEGKFNSQFIKTHNFMKYILKNIRPGDEAIKNEADLKKFV